MNILFLLAIISSPLLGGREKPQKLRPKIIAPIVNNRCINETNPCGTEVYNGTLKCCPGLECYEETACIHYNFSSILEKHNITFGNCYNKTLIRKIINTLFIKVNKTEIKMVRKKKIRDSI
jgi:hypothetical protein